MLSYVLAASWKATNIGKAYRFDFGSSFRCREDRCPLAPSEGRNSLYRFIAGRRCAWTEPHLAIFYGALQRLRRNIFKTRWIFAPSQGLKELSERTDPFLVQVIPNGVDLELFRPAPERRPKILTLFSSADYTPRKMLGIY